MCDQYKLTLFNSKGVQVEVVEGLAIQQAYDLAESKRPTFGGSYVTCESTALTFKPFRPTWPKKGYKYPSVRRSTVKSIKATAIRFAKGKDHSNSKAMLDLLNRSNTE